MRSVKIQPRTRGADIKRLNPKQILFVEALLATNDFNSTAAARAAGYKNPSHSAGALLKNEIICAAVGKAITERKKEFQIDAKRILEELACIATVDPGDLFNEKSELLPIKKMPEAVRRAISSFDVEVVTERNKETGVITTTTSIKPRFWSKTNALELMMKHLGMLEERFKVDQNIGIDPALITMLMDKLSGRPKDMIVDAKFIEARVIE